MSTDTHLTNQEIAKCAEAINEGKYDSLPSSLREHLSNCDYCTSEVMFVSEVSEELENELITDKIKEKKLRIKPWQISAVSIAAAAAVLFFIITFMDNNQDTSEVEIAHETEAIPEIFVVEEEDTIYPEKHHMPETADVSPKEISKEDTQEESKIEDKPGVLLAEYEPNENLEQLYENMKGVYRNNNITVNTPRTILYEEEDSLSWDNPEKDKLYIEFFNNREEEIKTVVTDNSRIAIPEFPAGLYYWKLINEHFDLLYVGKIIVE